MTTVQFAKRLPLTGVIALALAFLAVATVRTPLAQTAPVQCNAFIPLRDDAQQKAAAVRTATEQKAERKEVCNLVTSFTAADAAVLKFLETNKTWCGIPEEAIQTAKINHERTLKFRNMACNETSANGTPSVDTAGTAHTIPSSRKEVALKKQGGTFVVPVQINGAITLDFTVDSGAADVSVPLDVFSTLRRTGTIKDTDITGEQTYVLADGSTQQSFTFTIRSLKIGDIVVKNVRGSIASAKGSLLLGQSFLERFKSWSIDNTKHVLLLEPQ